MAYIMLTRSGITGLAVAGLLAVAGCSSTSSTPPAQAGDAQGGAPAGGETQGGGGEAVAVDYVDSRYHYRIDSPGRVIANPDGSASFIGPSERMQITVVSGAKAADISALAREDSKAMATSLAGFRQLSSPAAVTLGGYHMTRFGFTWNAGTSSVTGKAVELTSVQYYVPKNAGTVAVITYGIVTNQFDPQGADDLASTFKWL